MTCASPAPIYSTLGSDEDLGELVEMFVAEMPARLADMSQACAGQDWERLQRLAHQLKGSAGSYGFDDVTPLASRLEAAVRDRRGDDEIRLATHDLLELCSRLRAGAG
jgi:HPt (histidine-containing phosphotransfer) domain-containing protein